MELFVGKGRSNLEGPCNVIHTIPCDDIMTLKLLLF